MARQSISCPYISLKRKVASNFYVAPIEYPQKCARYTSQHRMSDKYNEYMEPIFDPKGQQTNDNFRRTNIHARAHVETMCPTNTTSINFNLNHPLMLPSITQENHHFHGITYSMNPNTYNNISQNSTNTSRALCSTATAINFQRVQKQEIQDDYYSRKIFLRSPDDAIANNGEFQYRVQNAAVRNLTSMDIPLARRTTYDCGTAPFSHFRTGTGPNLFDNKWARAANYIQKVQLPHYKAINIAPKVAIDQTTNHEIFCNRSIVGPTKRDKNCAQFKIQKTNVTSTQHVHVDKTRSLSCARLESKPLPIDDQVRKYLTTPKSKISLSSMVSIKLSCQDDKYHLTDSHCFIRDRCVQLFCATETDISSPRKGRKKKVSLGQVGIRCSYCTSSSPSSRSTGSVYYPSSVSGIYNATMIMQQRHFPSCEHVPKEERCRYNELKSTVARSGNAKQYWIDSAKQLGLMDTPYGIQMENQGNHGYSRLRDSVSAEQHLDRISSRIVNSSTNPKVVHPSDTHVTTAYSYFLMEQMRVCSFAESDRQGKRSNHTRGFPGLACLHCFGGNGSGRYFPSSVKTLSDTSKTIKALDTHISKCRRCPPDIKKRLEILRGKHAGDKTLLRFGAQKAFFDRIWGRMHHGKINDGTDRSEKIPSLVMEPQTNTDATAKFVEKKKKIGTAFAKQTCKEEELLQYDIARIMTNNLPIMSVKFIAK